MPTLPPVPGVLKIKLTYTIGDLSTVVNGFHMSYTGTAPTNAQLSTFAASIMTNYGTDLKALASAEVTLTRVDVIDLTTTSSAVGSATGTVVGTRAGNMKSAGTCVVLNFVIARRYRGGKPRLYLPFGTTADDNTPQTWGAVFLASVVSQFSAFNTANIAAVWAGGTLTAIVNVSYYSGFTNVPYGSPTKYRRTPTLRATPVVDASVSSTADSHYGSQRRRNR